jgi:hypothetical protein
VLFSGCRKALTGNQTQCIFFGVLTFLRCLPSLKDKGCYVWLKSVHRFSSYIWTSCNTEGTLLALTPILRLSSFSSPIPNSWSFCSLHGFHWEVQTSSRGRGSTDHSLLHYRSHDLFLIISYVTENMSRKSCAWSSSWSQCLHFLNLFHLSVPYAYTWTYVWKKMLIRVLHF